jgi:hypothetical protein
MSRALSQPPVGAIADLVVAGMAAMIVAWAGIAELDAEGAVGRSDAEGEGSVGGFRAGGHGGKGAEPTMAARAAVRMNLNMAGSISKAWRRIR